MERQPRLCIDRKSICQHEPIWPELAEVWQLDDEICCPPQDQRGRGRFQRTMKHGSRARGMTSWFAGNLRRRLPRPLLLCCYEASWSERSPILVPRQPSLDLGQLGVAARAPRKSTNWHSDSSPFEQLTGPYARRIMQGNRSGLGRNGTDAGTEVEAALLTEPQYRGGKRQLHLSRKSLRHGNPSLS